MDMIREFTKYCWNKHRPDFDEGVQKSKEMVEDAPVFQKAIPAYHQALAVIRKAVNDPTVRDNDQFYWVENSQETIFDHIWLILTTGKAFRQRAG